MLCYEAAIRVKQTNLKTMFENPQKMKIWKYKILYINLYLKDHLYIEFTAC